MNWVIIPARQGSKGLPFKNRKLFKYTADSIPPSMDAHVIVSTDDPHIRSMAVCRGFKVHARDLELCSDTADINLVLRSIVVDFNIPKEDTIIMLYLTYPTRTWEQVIEAKIFFDNQEASSLLCREEQEENEIHPYRWFHECKKNKGSQITKHDLYRRQDYPTMFKASHAIFIAKAGEIKKLNKNLWNKNTIFFPLGKMVDVDTPEDLKKMKDVKK